MAERQEQRDIQQIVATVISNLHSIPSSPGTSSSNGNSSNRFGNIEEEIRNVFSLPRNAASSTTVVNGIDGNEASSSNQNTSLAGRSSCPCASFPSASRPTLLPTSYSHLRNYSQGKRKSRKGKQPARSALTGRFEKGAGSSACGSAGQAKQCEPTFKDVCLLPSPSWETVPRLKGKASLIEKGLYIDAWSFQKTYQEIELKTAISSLFHERLYDNHGNEVG